MPATPAAEAATTPAAAPDATASPAPEAGEAPTADAAATTTTTNTTDATGRTRKRRLDVNPNLILSDGRSKRRKTPSPEPEDKAAADAGVEEGVYDPKDPARAKELGRKLYNRLLKAKFTDGEEMAEPFMVLPDREELPDYYEVIKHPMSFEEVKQKLDKGEYETLKAVVTDVGQIFVNAKRYNVKESTIFQYAKKLHKMTRTFWEESSDPSNAPGAKPSTPAPAPSAAPEAKVEEDDDEDSNLGRRSAEIEQSIEPDDAAPGGPSGHSVDGDSLSGTGRRGKRGSYMKDGPTVYKLVKPLLRTIKEARAKDGSGREISGIFMDLPDPKELPDYYETIAKPVSLKQIEERMIGRVYQTYQEFYEDIGLMCRNAMTYNEDESEVFKDAQQILEILEAHRPSIEDRLSRPNIPINRSRPSTSTPTRPADPSAYAQRPHQGYPSSTSNAYPPHTPQSIPGPSTSAQGNYLPPLPKGVVTEDIVASLERYPPYEQTAWAQSLPPMAMNLFRQIAAAHTARKRGLPVPAINVPTSASTLADLPSSARANGATSLPDRLAPPLPTIKYLDFAFSTAGSADRSSAIRLHNMRGVVTHAVVLGSDTSELELTAYITDSSKTAEKASTPAASSTTIGGAAPGTPAPVDPIEAVAMPELSLRMNGSQGPLPKPVHSAPAEGDSPSARPTGMRWTINVPPSRAETKIEVVATKPGALAETSAIFVSRQY